MFSVGLQNSAICNGVAKLGVTPSGHLGALCSPTSSSSSMSPSQDPYTFLDTPQSPSSIYSPLKISSSAEQFKNGHFKLTNGDIDNKYKKSFTSIANNFHHDISKDITSKVYNANSVISTPKTKCVDQIVNHLSTGVNFSNTNIKVEPGENFDVLAKTYIKSEVESDVKYLNKTCNKLSVQQNVINFTNPKKLPSGKPRPLEYQQFRSGKLSKRAPGLHEALQRTRGAKNDGEWHAPGAYVFDYDLCTIQRLDRNRSDSSIGHSNGFTSSCWFQKTWFSSHLQQASGGVGESIPRDLRLSLRRALFRRRTEQETTALRCALQDSLERYTATSEGIRNAAEESHNLERIVADGAAREAIQALRKLTAQKKEDGYERNASTRLIGGQSCSIDGGICRAQALPCSAYCARHVAKCEEQHLFRHCTAKFADNTQCSVPVFDVRHELPLCREHALKRDNYNKMTAESKPKKTPRKRPKPCAMIRPQKRNKKKKRIITKSPESIPVFEETNELTDTAACETSSACESSEDTGAVSEIAEVLSESELPGQDQIVEQVLSFAPEIASRLLEETDFTNVLNQIPPDAFNDLFAVDEQEGQYEPNMEEAAELERALEAVDEEVKSLEKLTSAHGMLMDGLLDDRCIAETLAQLG